MTIPQEDSVKSNPSKKPIDAFIIVDGNRVFPLNKTPLKIGRKSDNDIILQNPHVSRHHAEIRFQDGEFHIIDLQSTVGTSVNGLRIMDTTLESGDVISVGGVPLIFGRGKGNIHIVSEDKEKGISYLNTGPTDTIELQDADRYLDFFKD